MRFRNLDLNLLAALDKLITLRSVTRAADELAITQSAMSNALNRLRQYFDDPLLVQVGRHMELTPRAESLAGPVRDILVRVEAAITAPLEFDPATAVRRVNVMVSDYTLHTLMPAFVRRVAQAAPHIALDIKAQQMHPSVQLERGEADLLIAPGVFCSPDHPKEMLLSDPFVIVADASHPAAQAGVLTLADIETYEFVAMKPPQTGESYSNRYLREHGLAVKTAVTCFSFAALPELVAGTNRLALIQGRLAATLAGRADLAILAPPFDVAPMEQCVQWHQMRGHDPALHWLRGELLAVAAQ